MYSIAKREFFQLFKSIKSILIIALLLLTTYYAAKFADVIIAIAELSSEEAKDAHTAGLLFFMLLFGQLFVMALSHDVMNREIYERTMRFLVTRTSRTSIIAGKFWGVWLFWFSCVTAAFLVTIVFSKHFNLFLLAQTISLFTFQVALAVLLSVIIPKPAFSMFIGVMAGIAFPFFGFWAAFLQDSWYSALRFLSPYTYLIRDDYTFLVVFIGSAAMLLAANELFKRREC